MRTRRLKPMERPEMLKRLDDGEDALAVSWLKWAIIVNIKRSGRDIDYCFDEATCAACYVFEWCNDCPLSIDREPTYEYIACGDDRHPWSKFEEIDSLTNAIAMRDFIRGVMRKEKVT